MSKTFVLVLLLSLIGDAAAAAPYIGEVSSSWSTTRSVTATASSKLTGDSIYGPEKTINGGLFTASNGDKGTDGIHHSYAADQAWISAAGNYGFSNPAGQSDCVQWIKFAFDKVYFITNFDVWNGCMTGPGGGALRSFKNIKIHYSGDGLTWTQLLGPGVNGMFPLNPVPTYFSPYYFWYDKSDRIVMNRAAKFVVISGYSNYGAAEYAMSEVRFYYHTGYTQSASIPNPPDASLRIPTNTILSWTPGAIALSHDVYLGTNYDAVHNATRLAGDLNEDGNVDFRDFSQFGNQWQSSVSGRTADWNDDGAVDLLDFKNTISASWLTTNDGVFRGHFSLVPATYQPPRLEPGQNYYWRVDEVNGTVVAKGTVWNFIVMGTSPSASVYYVATNGSDANDGLTPSTPFKTITKARDTIANCSGLPPGGVTVLLRGGKYFLDRGFELTSLSSGTPSNPIVFRAYTNEVPRLIGGIQLEPSWFSIVPASDGVFSNRLPGSTKGFVYSCDLSLHGITNLGRLRTRGVSYGETFHVGAVSHMELSCDGIMMQLAKWPNSGYATISSGSTNGLTFTYSGSPANELLWPNATDPWVHGFWNYDFYDQYLPVTSFNVTNNLVTLDEAPGNPSIMAGQRWQACNLLEALDEPGEYYVERKVGDPNYGKLFFWPPGGSIVGKELIVSTLGEGEQSLVALTGVSNVIFQSLMFELSRFNAVLIKDCTNVLLDNCTIRNVGNIGIRVEGGSSCGVQNSKIYGVGLGIGLSGGDRYTLTASGHFARNNEIYNFGRWIKAYQSGVAIYGVGNEASNNQIYNGPHSAILFYHNNHLIQCNKVFNVVTETSDAGALYSYWGWDNRGSMVKWNCIYDITNNVPGGTGVWGIYLDGYTSGTTLYGNIIDNVSPGGSGSAYTGAIILNGGRDNEINNCVLTYNLNAITSGEWCAYPVNQADAQRTRVSQFNYRNPPWSTQYPALAAIPATGDISIYAHPGGCKIINTLEKGNSVWAKVTLIEGKGDPYNPAYCFQSGNMLNTDPLYVDRANKFFAPTHGGLSRIPFERIGLLHQTQASNPIPRNNSTAISKTTTALYWAAAFGVAKHKVYFGTIQGALPLVSAGQNYASFVPPALQSNTTYYWRIDEVDSAGAVTAGAEWRFTAGP